MGRLLLISLVFFFLIVAVPPDLILHSLILLVSMGVFEMCAFVVIFLNRETGYFHG
jgi:hypothetical protein